MKRIALLLSIILVGGIISTAQADIIANWDMYGLEGNESFVAATDSAANITASDMIRGAGLGANSGDNSFNSKGWDDAELTDYVEIGFSVADGFGVTLDELWLGSRSSNTGPGTIGVYTSLDNYAAAVYEITQSDTDYSNSIIDLSSLGIVDDDFYIRFYAIGTTPAGSSYTSIGSSGTWRITDYYDGSYTDVQITGTVSAVPVPAALWLMITGILGFVGYKRKKN